ncbi:MAG: multicopper oxidase domain-containing protein [Gammaproteobacteria bacterium]
MKRRSFLKLGGAGMATAALATTGLITWTPRAHAATINKTFYITDGFITQPDGVNVYFKGFSSSSNVLNVPGDQLIVQEGDTVNITIVNTLGRRHYFTIDGLGISTLRIDAGTSRTLSFTAGTPGSYMYLDPSNAPYNRLVGLHGGFAIMPKGRSNQLYAGSPTFVQQYFWLFNDIDPVWHNTIRNGGTPSSRYSPRYFTLNGLMARPPGAPGNHDPNIDAMADPRSALHGHIGDRTLVRVLNAGKCQQSVHTHGNHMEWITDNGQIRPDVWSKDAIYLEGNKGKFDAIFPFEAPPDAWPPVTTGVYPMHLHTEMSQTAGGGLYMFGALTDIFFE